MARSLPLNPITAVVGLVALVALTCGTAYATAKINGKDIKANTVTGKQIKESTLATVPNAAKLGGHKASAFVPANRVQTTGLIRLPADNKNHVVFVRSPLKWVAKCHQNPPGTSILDLTVYPTESANLADPNDAAGDTVPKSGDLIDNFSGTGLINSNLPYQVLGADGATYSGTFSFILNLGKTPCAVSINAIG